MPDTSAFIKEKDGLQVLTISPIMDYPLNDRLMIITNRRGLLTRQPSDKAPSPNQAGSIDWTIVTLFGSTEAGVRMIESLVAGQGANAEDKWIEFCLLYRQWELKWRLGELPEKPTLNQVCYALEMETALFLRGLQREIQSVMTTVGSLKATLRVPDVVDKVVEVALSDEGDVNDRKLALELGGALQPKGGIQVNVNQQNAVILKGDKDRMKAPLLQFSETVDALDDSIRSGDVIDMGDPNATEIEKTD